MDNEEDPSKKFTPPAKDESGDEPEKKEETGDQAETIEAVLDLFDQLTPLVEKLRSK